jgi:hypothetical protein
MHAVVIMLIPVVLQTLVMCTLSPTAASFGPSIRAVGAFVEAWVIMIMILEACFWIIIREGGLGSVAAAPSPGQIVGPMHAECQGAPAENATGVHEV